MTTFSFLNSPLQARVTEGPASSCSPVWDFKEVPLPYPSIPGQPTDHPTSIHARSAHRPPQIHQCQVSAETPPLHPCQVSTRTTPPPSMPGQHTDHPTSIHAKSAHRPPHLHPRQVTTQTTPAPFMPGQCRDTPDPSMPGQCRDTPDPSLPGQHSDHPTSIHARSAQRPPQLYPFQVGTQTTHLQISQPGDLAKGLRIPRS